MSVDREEKMIVQDNFLKKLRSAFNLNIYEVKIWTALLSKGVATAGELSDISEVPRSRSYDVLESLEKRGFVIMKLGKPIKYIAVKPEEVFRRLKKKVYEEADAQLKSLTGIESTDLYNELSLLFNVGIKHVDPTTISGFLKGRVNMYDHLSTLIDNSKKSVNMVTSATGFVRKYNNLKESIKKAAKRGVEVRIVTPVTNDNKDVVKDLSQYAKIKNDNGNSRFVTIDNAEAVLMLADDASIHESYDNAIWVSSPYFVISLNSMFTNLWKKQ